MLIETVVETTHQYEEGLKAGGLPVVSMTLNNLREMLSTCLGKPVIINNRTCGEVVGARIDEKDGEHQLLMTLCIYPDWLPMLDVYCVPGIRINSYLSNTDIVNDKAVVKAMYENVEFRCGVITTECINPNLTKINLG